MFLLFSTAKFNGYPESKKPFVIPPLPPANIKPKDKPPYFKISDEALASMTDAC